EGFGQVVVGAQGESGDPVAGGSGGGEHEDHDRVAGCGDRAADGVAVDAGQVPVQYDYVVGIEAELEGGVGAVVGDVGRDALVAQALGDIVGQPPDVLGDQHPHRAPPATASCAVGLAVPAAGRSMTALRPPSGRACRRSVPPCAAAIAWVMDSPTAVPAADPVRSAWSRLNGCARVVILPGSRMGPPFSTSSRT